MTTGDNPTIPGTGLTKVGTGKGGKITITAPALKISDGAVIDARTFNDQPGGDINLTLGTLQLLNGGQILTTSESSGAAGTIAINANQGVTIAGNDTTYSSRLNRFLAALLKFHQIAVYRFALVQLARRVIST